MKILYYSLFLFLFFMVSVSANANTISAQVSKYNDEYIATVTGQTDITNEFGMNAEVDSTGYLSVGADYGKMFGSWYVEGFVTYGRADVLDIYDLGGFTATSFDRLQVYYMSYHQWRRTKGFPVLELKLFDQREWKNTLGFGYSVLDWLELGVSFNYDRLLSDNTGFNEVKNDSINSQDLTLTLKQHAIQPYVRYTTGVHRVRPGEPITRSDSWEFGARFRY
jgi:hypothetical protein